MILLSDILGIVKIWISITGDGTILPGTLGIVGIWISIVGDGTILLSTLGMVEIWSSIAWGYLTLGALGIVKYELVLLVMEQY